jgi:DHA1 family bicyclomycin/chloramphenicol resistance-like MFS transporter
MNIQQKINLKHFILLALALTLLGVSSTDIYISSLPEMVVFFQTTPNLVNLTLSVYTLSMGIAVLFTGVLSNRFGRRKILLTGIMIFILSSFAIAASSSIYWVIFFRIGQAYGCASLLMVCRLIIKDTMTPQEQIHASGVLVMGVVISPAVAPSIGAVLAQFGGWQSGFLLSGIFASILLVGAMMIVKETNTTPIAQLRSLKAYIKEYVNLLLDTKCLLFTLIIALTFAAYFVFIGISSYLFINKAGMSPLVYSYLFVIIAGGYFVGNSSMMWLNKRDITPLKLILLGMFISLLGLVILGMSLVLAYGFWFTALITLGILIMRLASALIIVPAQVELMQHFHEQGAQALGLATCAQFAFASLAITLAGLFHDQPGYGLIIVTAIFFIPVVFLALKLRAIMHA